MSASDDDRRREIRVRDISEAHVRGKLEAYHCALQAVADVVARGGTATDCEAAVRGLLRRVS